MIKLKATLYIIYTNNAQVHLTLTKMHKRVNIG